MQAIADALCPVPLQAIEEVPDRVVAVFVGNYHHGILYFFLNAKSIGFLKIQEQIFDVHIGQGWAVPISAEGLHNIRPFGQQILADRSFQQRIMLQDTLVIRRTVGSFPLLGQFQTVPYFLHRRGDCLRTVL